jgi:hypothetical protein
MKTCVLFNIINHRQENKTETSKPNLTNLILPVCLALFNISEVKVNKIEC